MTPAGNTEGTTLARQWPPAYWVASYGPTGQLQVTPDASGLPTGRAEGGGCQVLFEGIVHEREALRRELGTPEPASNADLFLGSYLRWGEEAFRRVSGLFGAVVTDARNGRLLAARDPLGIYPLFYAETPIGLELSLSIEALLARPSVPQAVNRFALVDHLCHRWPSIDETYFEAIRRVPAGTLLVRSPGGRTDLQRYWDPSPPGQPITWVTEPELGRFDELLEQAVRRLVELGPVGIYLSGGLDSVTVAAIAADEARKLGAPPPEGLSLVFEHESANEEPLQRQVGAALSLPHTVVPMSQTLSEGGLLRNALAVSARRPAPLLSLWEPAYAYLAAQGREHGCRTILTGSGGDEWLEFNPAYAADLIRSGQPRLLFEVWQTMHRSYRISRARAARHVLWTYGVRTILRRSGRRGLRRTAPQLLAAHHRRRIDAATPAWVVPDPGLRAQLLERHQLLLEGDTNLTHYMREVRRSLDSPIVASELEETFERGRRVGVPILHPFLDADLASFLYVTPPKLLMIGGRTKGLIRRYVSRRFPELGFERQRKLNANAFFAETLVNEGREIWRETGGARALAALGIVDLTAADAAMKRIFDGQEPLESFRVWYVLSLEAWLRPRIGVE
jgi:asparagine synthase (glutamine-hydrolysing)